MRKPLTLLVVLAVCTLAAAACKSNNADDIAAFEKAQQTTPAEHEAEAAKQAEQVENTEKADDNGDKPAADAKAGAQATDLEPGEQRHFGAPFTLETQPIALAAALEKSKDSEGPYKVEATVEKVCQVKGCWFTLAADGVEVPIRVRMKDYAFFVSKNAAGAQAVLEGTLVRKTIDQKLAQHFADDEARASDKPARQVTADEETFEFMASSIELVQTQS